MLSKFLQTKFHLRFVLNPFIRFAAGNLGKHSGVNIHQKRDFPVIVSLTSYGERFCDLVISLYSLLNQSFKPDKIILWLSDEYTLSDLPYDITRFIKNGLEIRFVKDIRSYTKIIYTLKEYSNAVIVTADDDIFYPRNWLKRLYYSYLSYPEDIHVHRAHRAVLGVNDRAEVHNKGEKSLTLLPYESWEKHVSEESARFDNFLTGVGGVLYPPKCFTSEVLRQDIFLKNAPFADDVWLWVMALVHNRKIRVVKHHIKTLACVNIFRQLGFGGKTLYSINQHGENDRQLDNLMKLYGQNILPKLR